MNTEAQAPLWATLAQENYLSELSSVQLTALIKIFAEYLENSCGPSIQTWHLRNEAEHANRVHRDLVRHNISRHLV